MNAWSHLPNAAHIDSVIASAKAYPDVWVAKLDAAWYASRAASRAASSAKVEAFATRNVALTAAWDAAWYAARGAVLALVVYDDSSKYLSMTPDQLRVWATLSEEPAAVLLLPAVIAYEKINELEIA